MYIFTHTTIVVTVAYEVSVHTLYVFITDRRSCDHGYSILESHLYSRVNKYSTTNIDPV